MRNGLIFCAEPPHIGAGPVAVNRAPAG